MIESNNTFCIFIALVPVPTDFGTIFVIKNNMRIIGIRSRFLFGIYFGIRSVFTFTKQLARNGIFKLFIQLRQKKGQSLNILVIFFSFIFHILIVQIGFNLFNHGLDALNDTFF